MKLLDRLRMNIRLIVQIIFTGITNANFKGFLTGTIHRGSSKMICAPGLNCYSCPGALGSCPIGSMQAVLNSRDYSLSLYIGGFIASIGASTGRLTCGYFCPFGLYQDLLHKIKLFKKKKSLKFEKHLRKLKYIFLFVFVLILPASIKNIAGVGSPYFCKYICPSGSLLAGIPLVLTNLNLRAAISSLFFWKLFILISLSVLSIKVYRPFCRYICPLGAAYGFFNPISLYKYKIDEEACIDCGLCKKRCEFSIPVNEEPNSMECIRCGECMKVCPTNAISSNLNLIKYDKRASKD